MGRVTLILVMIYFIGNMANCRSTNWLILGGVGDAGLNGGFPRGGSPPGKELGQDLVADAAFQAVGKPENPRSFHIYIRRPVIR